MEIIENLKLLKIYRLIYSSSWKLFKKYFKIYRIIIDKKLFKLSVILL